MSIKDNQNNNNNNNHTRIPCVINIQKILIYSFTSKQKYRYGIGMKRI